ncbi:acyltransferase family protein [Catellatospora tritici]|uniref:acyltransferase family protein n=1 Tax=Catellatospora tritici TaxID=2851566 RepID=UPI001C2D9FF9|nr:acyltransferase [Catellatospora tritici]MBV1854696.1 acyltransferase [Catellatospora tritici]
MSTATGVTADATVELPRVVGPVQHRSPAEQSARPGREGGGDRLRALDGLRWLAALSVVAYHYLAFGRKTGAWGVRPAEIFPVLSQPASYGWLGVQVFFLISGFVICMSAWGRGVSHFFVSRASRLYPAYWVSVLLITAVVTLWPVVVEPRTAREVLVNLTMLQTPLGAPHVDGLYWTLWVELVFYLLFSVLVWRGLTYRRVLGFCMIWTVAAVLLPALKMPLVNTLVMRDYAPYFVAGIVCYLIHRFGPSPLLWGVLGVNWIIAVYRMYPEQAEHVRVMGGTTPAATWPALLIITGAFALVAAIALGWFSWARWRWLTTLGALTYPTYLLHEYPGWTAFRLLVGELPPLLIVALVFTGVIVLAWVVHRYFERPASRLMRRSLNQAFARIPQA